MTEVGWIGLGKLGLPCALALERYASVGVTGYDVDPRVRRILAGDALPPNREEGIDGLLAATRLYLASSVSEVVEETDGLVFVAVQTPHAPEYGGEAPMPTETRDFDYTYLTAVVEEVAVAADRLEKPVTLVVVSTALPGTMDRDVVPKLGRSTRLLYNPFFIAMGTTVRDFREPEFVLVGAAEPADAAPLLELYRRIPRDVPVRVLTYAEAELTKVAYNTFISLKIVFANTLLEICHAGQLDVDAVTGTLALATDRVVSPAYLRGGMGDGGACHPRDNIAMSWLAGQLGLAANPFEFVTRAREAQTRQLAVVVAAWANLSGLPVVVLGKAYKPASDLTYGSPALLLAHYLTEMGVDFTQCDPYVDGEPLACRTRAVYVVATRHPEYETVRVPPGSVVLDPHRYVRDQPDVKLVHLGRGRSS